MARVRRNTELGLILLGSVIVVGAYTLASLGQNASIPVDLGPFLGVVLGLIVFGERGQTRQGAMDFEALSASALNLTSMGTPAISNQRQASQETLKA